DTRLREAGAEVVYCLTRGAPKGPNLPRVRLNHQDALFPGHGKATHSQTSLPVHVVLVRRMNGDFRALIHCLYFLSWKRILEAGGCWWFFAEKDLDALYNVECVLSEGNLYNLKESHNPGQLHTLPAVVNDEAQPVVYAFMQTSDVHPFLELGVHNTVEELWEAQKLAQMRRLNKTENGKWLLAQLGLTIPGGKPEPLEDLTSDMREKISVSPIPRHMHLVHNAERRRARAEALGRLWNNDQNTLYVDAAGPQEGHMHDGMAGTRHASVEASERLHH
ncbi:hypothetical protein HPB47_016376, partial [Ixodes persulcatus]